MKNTHLKENSLLLLKEKTSNLTLLSAAILSGALLWMAWPPNRFNFLIFLALVPLLWLEDRLRLQSKKPAYKLVLFSYLTFFTWNALTTWWIAYASPEGAVMAIVLNSLLMTLPVFFYTGVKKHAGRYAGYFALLCFWLTFEHMHFNWDAPWPWLALGNVWATSTDFVQWYEYTGTAGGTIWVWVGNFLIYEMLRAYSRFRRNESEIKPSLIILAALLIWVQGLILISYAVKPHEPLLSSNKNIVAVQPNIDPYTEKFNRKTFGAQINKLIELSEKEIDSNTVLLMWPETALAEDIDEETIFAHESINNVHAFLKRHPQLKLLTGISSHTIYRNRQQRPTATARPTATPGLWYDAFNTALLLDTTQNVALYHKSKLVPGVEKMPYPAVLGFLESLIINLGGASVSLGSQDTPSIFNIGNELKIAPIICYESVFGEVVTKFVKGGTDVICIITNDGWWRDTDGYKQHMLYGRLRAIENRRFIARSANTGISCFITETGHVIEPQPFWQPGVIKSYYSENTELTFYTRYGDYLARICMWLGLALIGWAMAIKFGLVNLASTKKL